jgi:peptidoglycan-associated lipoprotein
MNHLKTLSILFSAAALLSACSSAPIAAEGDATATPVSTSANGSANGGAGANSTSASTVASVTLPAYLDPQSEISTKRSIYFGYDDFSISQEGAAVVERHGKYLKANPSVSIKIEGHTDERGGVEYNLALGQKRAEAAQRALLVYGVKASQLEAVSWGKEKPQATGHDEASWAQNRRDDFQYPAK